LATIGIISGPGPNWNAFNTLRHVETSGSTIPNWNWMWDTETLLLNQPDRDFFLVFLSASYGNQVNVLAGNYYTFIGDWINPSTSPLGPTASDSTTVPLAGPYDLEIVTTTTGTFLVAAALGDKALTVFRIDVDSGFDSGGLTFVGAATDPDLTDFSDPLRQVKDLAQLTVRGQTFIVAQSDVYGELSTWRFRPDGQVVFADAVGGYGFANNPVTGLTQVAATTLDGRGYVVAIGREQVSLFEVTNRGVLTLKDTDPVLALGPGQSLSCTALDIVQIDGRTFVYAGMTGFGNTNMVAYEILPSGELSERSLLPMAENISMIKAEKIDGADVLVVTTQTGPVFARVFTVQPDGTLRLLTELTNDNTFEVPTNPPDMYVVQSADLTQHYGVPVLAVTSAYSANINGHTHFFELGDDSSDEVLGDGTDNVLLGLVGSDTLKGGGGNDRLYGGYNDPEPADGPGAQDYRDALYGGNGNDTLNGGKGGDDLFGGNGRDMLDYSTSNARVTINLGTGAASGGDAEGDTFTGMEDILGSRGNDNLKGDGGKNVIYGNAGRDQIWGMSGDDRLFAGDMNDEDTHSDTIYGGGGNDRLYSGGGNDVFYGGNDNDTLMGVGYTGSNDSFYGDAGDDFLYGGVGNDFLSGGTGNDVLFGGKQNDTLLGGQGNDSLQGGSGADRFVFFPGFAGNDLIIDMTVEDRVVLAGFTGIADFGDVLARTSDVNGEAVLIPEAGQRITFLDVSKAQLTAGMFEYSI
jgi:Ca2+-binding RTX toxin-like protein